MQLFQQIKKNAFTYGMVTLTLMIFIAAFTRTLNVRPGDDKPTSSETAFTSETPETPTEIIESAYFFIKNGNQKEVIGIRPLEQDEYPKNFKFTDYDESKYRSLRFYEVALLELSSDPHNIVSIVTPLHLIYFQTPSSTDTVYRQMSIRYEDGFAIYTFDRETFVTALNHPKLYRTYTLYGSPFPASQTVDPQTLKIFESTFYNQTFDTNLMQYITEIKPQEDPLATPFDWESKTITHLASDKATHGPSLSKITDEPRMKKIVLNASTSGVFEAIGNPVNKGWLMGDYLTYDDLLVYCVIDENDQNVDLYPVVALAYFGDYPIAGVKKGMSFASVEQILGIPDRLSFSENNEFAYPLMLEYAHEGFSIGISFNSHLEVTNFFINVDEWSGEAPTPFVPYIDEDERAYSVDKLSFEGLYDITDFKYSYNACFFNASDGFYRYDFTRSSPERVHQDPMRAVFDIQYDANPSLIAVGKNDGILYKINLNTYETTPLSGANYIDYFISGGTLINKSLISDETP